MFQPVVEFVRELYGTREAIALHIPSLRGNAQRYVSDAIESTFVSSVGAYVDRFEREMARYTGAERAVATVNGTAALHVALRLAQVGPGDLVLTQPLTFVATCNAIAYCGAEPVFIDVDLDTLGLSAAALEAWLSEHAQRDAEGTCRSRHSGQRIPVCLPMHTFGHPADLDGLLDVCQRWGLMLVEDAAESLGSLYRGRHTGTLGHLGALSFNGNKIITTGGGGMVLADQAQGTRAKHLTTTAKVPHAYEYVHDEIGFNYRMPNLNAALGCAQLEELEAFVEAKREVAQRYAAFFDGQPFRFVAEPEGCRSNYWLNAVLCEDRAQRDALLAATNQQGVMTRPIWTLMTRLPAFAHCRAGPLPHAEWLEDRVVNLPSSVPSNSGAGIAA